MRFHVPITRGREILGPNDEHFFFFSIRSNKTQIKETPLLIIIALDVQLLINSCEVYYNVKFNDLCSS